MAHDTVVSQVTQQSVESKAAHGNGTATAAPKAPATASPVDPRGPVLALATVVAFVLWTSASQPVSEGVALPWTLNPTGYLSLGTFALLYAITIPAKHVMDAGLIFLAERVCGFPRMDQGDAKVKKLEVLETIDLCYLALNTIVEFIGMNHIAACLLGAHIEKPLASFNIMNGPIAFVLAMFVNDVIYYPFHCVAHKRWSYPYVHKQHHRQFLPFRGYADAANQHPIEQTYGFSIFIASLHIASATTGLHAATAWCATLAWALLNTANHLAFDSLVHLPLPYPAYPRDHQMHHRFPQCNYSTLTSIMDRYFGSFVSYKVIGEPKVSQEQAPRPEAVPSPFSVLALGAGLVAAGLIAEIVRTGALPLSSDVAVFVPALMFLAATASACAASALLVPKASQKQE